MKRGIRNDSAEKAADSSSKRPRRPTNSDAVIKAGGHTQGPMDPVFGQRSALPNLGDLDEDTDDFEKDGGLGIQALKYLQAVREEANLIPPYIAGNRKPNLNEQDQSIYANGIGDARGFYEDGAYTAAPEWDEEYEMEDAEESYDELKAQEKLREGLIAGFTVLRKSLISTVPPDALLRLDDDHGYVAEPTAQSSRQWLWRFKNTDPLSAQVAKMDKGTVLRLLRLLAAGKGGLLGPKREIEPRTARWIWSLLARLPDRGELLSAEIGAVRELGKMAVRIVVGWRDVQNWGMQIEELLPQDEMENKMGPEDLENTSRDPVEVEAAAPHVALPTSDVAPQPLDKIRTNADDLYDTPLSDRPVKYETDNQVVDALESARARLLSQLSPAELAGNDLEAGMIATEDEILDDLELENDEQYPTQNTKLTVEMILTIAGEVYGQRDLLEFREVWD